MHPLYHDFKESHLLDEIKKDLAAKQARWQQGEQKLSIGVMGQVKAGKSSFLNALLFSGKAILPEAATPKTANLTKIAYAEQYTLKVEYYTADEWQEIKNTAAQPSQSVQTAVAKELLAMVSSLTEAQINQCLNCGSELITAENLDGLKGKLNQYTGNNGSHTALVKNTEITLPLADLKGFEIVDTPGMNDPVQSRTQKTRDYMANCDVVFFLSRCSQFLDKADDELLREQLPSKGIKRLVLIAGQYDSAIIDDGYNRDSLAQTLQNLTQRLTRVAQTKAQEITSSKQLDPTQKDMLMASLSAPVFASTYAHGFATWDRESWSDAMENTYQELNEIAEQEWQQPFTQQDWQTIGNFAQLQAIYQQAKADKDAVLQEQKNSVLPNAYTNMFNQYTSLAQSVQQYIELISTKEVADIEAQRKACEQKMQGIGATLAFTLSQARNEANQSASELIAQLKHDQVSFTQLATRTGTEQIERSRTVSTSEWYNPLSWGDTKTEYYTVTKSYQYLSSHDAIEQINLFGQQSAQQIVASFGKMVAPSELKLRLKKALLNELDTQSEDFDPTLFKTMLENFIAKIILPIFEIDLGDTTSLIAGNFSAEVRSDNEMEQLRSQLDKSLAMVLAKLQGAFEAQLKVVMQKLETAEQGLKEALITDINHELEKVKQQINDKENQVANYQALLTEVVNCKDEVEQKLATL